MFHRTVDENSISRALFGGYLSWLCPIVYLFGKLKVRSLQHHFKKMAIAVFRDLVILHADPIGNVM